MSRIIPTLALLTTCAASFCAPRVLRADDSDAPKIQKVLAIEEAGSYYGKYRIVFSISEPMPAPRNAVGTPTFYLGTQKVTLPARTGDATLLFGYVNELPDANVMFKVISATPAAGMASRAPADEVAIEPRTLLAASRVGRGGFEAEYVHRSVGPVDVWSAWSNSDSVFVGELMRRDVDPANPRMYRLYFKPGDVLKGSATSTTSGMLVHATPLPMYELELGGRYLLFGKKSENGSAIQQIVRLWWPGSDFVLEYLRGRTAIGGNDRSRLRDFLFQEITTNPAVEARLAAGAELATLIREAPLSADQRRTLQDRAAIEPSPVVRQTMRPLLSDQ